MLMRSYSSLVQDFTFPFVELHGFFSCLFLQPVEVPLNGSPTTMCISHSSWFYVIFELVEDALCPIIQIINEVAEQS